MTMYFFSVRTVQLCKKQMILVRNLSLYNISCTKGVKVWPNIFLIMQNNDQYLTNCSLELPS